jgi:hypothetical protein
LIKNSINTALALFFLATAVMVIAGLAVIPALEGFQRVQAEPEPKWYCKTSEGGQACMGLTNQDPFLKENNVKKNCRERTSVPGIPLGEGKCTRDKSLEGQ